MDQIISLAPYFLGAAIILALLNIFRNLMTEDEHTLDFDASPSEPKPQATGSYARQYNAFLAELEDLPEEYAGHIDLDQPSAITVPARTPVVGTLQVRFAGDLIVVNIGDHTEQRFTRQYPQAAKFILGILTDHYVFHIYHGRVDIYERSDFLGPEDLDRDYYVWSGRLLDLMLAEGK